MKNNKTIDEIGTPEIKSALMNRDRTRRNNPDRDAVYRKLAEQRERDEEIVTGIFKNYEEQASHDTRGMLRFGFKKYPGQTFDFYEMFDGETYSIPFMVADHINNGCLRIEHKRSPEGIHAAVAVRHPNGKMVQQQYTELHKIQRFAFVPTGFNTTFDDFGPSKKIIQLEREIPEIQCP